MTYHDEETEKEVIGSLLMDHQSYMDVFDILKPDHFYTPSLSAIYKVFQEHYESDKPLDTRTLVEKTGARADIIAECMEYGFLSAAIKNRAKKLVELGRKRAVKTQCQSLLVDLPNLDSIDIAARLSDIAMDISAGNTEKKVYSGDDMCRRVYKLQEQRYEDPGYIRGITSGMNILDNTVRGFRPKRMTVIAAATGFGKSTLAMNLFHRITRNKGKCLFISNENDIDDNLDRLCGITTGLDLRAVENGKNYEAVCDGFNSRYSGTTSFMSDNSPRTVDEILAVINRHAVQHQIEVVFVDYIGEISGDGKDKETEEMRLARYTQRLLDGIKSANVHLFLMAQLNRQGNSKGRPTKTELGGCFKIAQKAHTLLIFWKTEDGQDVLTVDKNRQGPPGVDIAVEFTRNNQRIIEKGYYNESNKTIVEWRGEPCSE